MTFVAKDLFAIAGHTSSFGISSWLETHPAAESTAPAIERLLEAGATMAGVVKLDQLAYSLIGDSAEGGAPKNPTHPERFAGGSSSGAASAVAGGLCQLGLGTDTAGSIRVPAASCGLFSFRPSHGSIPSDGVLPLAPSFDTVGLLGRKLYQLEEALNVLTGGHQSDSIPLGRVLLPREIREVEPATREAVGDFARALSDRFNVETEEVDFSDMLNVRSADLFGRLQAREIWALHGRWIVENRPPFAADIAARLERAEALAGCPDAEKAADLHRWDEYREAYRGLVVPGTAAILPVMEGLPPRRNDPPSELARFRGQAFRWATPASLTGSPQAVTPFSCKRTGVTRGVGLLGAPGQDRTLLRALRSVVVDGATS